MPLHPGAMGIQSAFPVMAAISSFRENPNTIDWNSVWDGGQRVNRRKLASDPGLNAGPSGNRPQEAGLHEAVVWKRLLV